MEWNESDYEAVLRQFQPRQPRLPEALGIPSNWRPSRRRLWTGVGAAAAILLLVLSISIVRSFMGPELHAVVEAADGSLSRVIGQDVAAIRPGDRIEVGDTVRSSADGGAVLALRDGTRVEMHDRSEFSLERADDGTRLRLKQGGLLINAAKPTGRFHVQTPNCLVTLVGTTFFVKADDLGTRVIVIEGQVEVQQGSTSKTLQTGEQYVSNPRMELLPIAEEISWSRNARAHLLGLQRNGLLPGPLDETQDRLLFEAVSIRQSSVAADKEGPCAGVISHDSRRFMARGVSLYQLISFVYGKDSCVLANRLGLLSGGPAWLQSRRLDVEALMPEVLLVPWQVDKKREEISQKRRIELMLRILLEERFKLVLRREQREMPVGVLTLDSDGYRSQGRQQGTITASLPDFISQLAEAMNTPVVNRTGLADEVVINHLVDFDTLGDADVAKELEALGLRLEPARAPVEVLVIEHVERPSAN